MNHYETAFLLSPDLGDKDVEKFAREARDFLTGNGATEVAEPRIERRALAYPLKKHTEGHYVFVSFTGPAALPEQLRVEFRHREEVLRQASVRKPALVEEPEPEEPAVEPGAGGPGEEDEPPEDDAGADAEEEDNG